MARLLSILRLQFGLKTLMGVIVVAAIASAYIAHLMTTVRVQREFLQAAANGDVTVQVNSEDFEPDAGDRHFRTFDQITSVKFSYGFRRDIASSPELLLHEPDFDALIHLIHPEVVFPECIERRTTSRQRCLNMLGQLRYLKSLSLQCEVLTENQLQSLRDLNQLEVLDLYDSNVSDADLTNISGLRDLRRLGLGDTCITDQGLKHLTALENLTLLDVGSTDVADGVSPSLQALKQIHWLYLDHTKITRLHLCGLHQLEYVTLCDTPVCELAIEDCPTLRLLDLGGTKVNERSLISVGKLSGLEVLDLVGTPITAAGLGQLRDLPSLKRLRLDVGEFDAELARELNGCKALQVLILNYVVGPGDHPSGSRTASQLQWQAAIRGIEVQWTGGSLFGHDALWNGLPGRSG